MYEDEYVLEERVDRLEVLLGRFIVNTDTALTRLAREMKDFKDEMKVFKDEMKDFKDEMKVFKDEMKDFKDEMKDFKDEMKVFKDEMKVFKDEMKDFKDEMKVFKDEMKDEMKVFKDEMKDFKDEMKLFKDEMTVFKDETIQDRRQMNKQWGDLANKMGTIVEDIVVPAIRPVIQKYFSQDIDYLSIKVKRKNKAMNLKGEFDVIGVTETSVFLVETKSSPNEEYLFKFIEHINLFRKLFTEYKDKPIVPIFASLRFDDDLIRLCTAKNIYVLAYREWDYMDILNFEDVARCSENIRQKYSY